MKPYLKYTNEQLRTLVELQFKYSDAPAYVEMLIDLAFEDDWNPVKDFDGCTMVQDFNHPDLSCFIHDWLWRTDKGGEFSNKLFYKLMRWENIKKSQAKRRYIAVSLAWKLWYKFKKRKKSRYSLSYVKNEIKTNYL